MFFCCFFITDDFIEKKGKKIRNPKTSLKGTHLDPQFKSIQTGLNTSSIDCFCNFASDDIIN